VLSVQLGHGAGAPGGAAAAALEPHGRWRRWTRPLRRFANYLLVALDRKLLRLDRPLGFPIEMTCDATAHCNLRCPLCPTGQGRQERERGHAEVEPFARLMDEVGDYLYSLSFSNWGEPILNPRFPDLVRIAKRHGIRTLVSVNFNAVTDARIDEIIQSGLDEMTVSLDGATQEAYARYRVGGDIARVLANVGKLLRRRRELSRTNPRVSWNFIVNRHNEGEVELARRMAREHEFDAFNVLPLRADMGREIFLSYPQRVENARDWLPSDAALTRYDVGARTLKAPVRTCTAPWTMAVVSWDGSVAPCCSVYDKKLDFGDAHADGFAAVWRNPTYRKSRRTIAGRDPEEDLKFVCTTCKYNGFIDF
jgi:radical SAM protein with 4Fe4S-binding SPASM domain